MSKLQQLAAARKKKAEEQKAGENSKENRKEKDVKDTTNQLRKLTFAPKDDGKKTLPTVLTMESASVSGKRPSNLQATPESRKRKNSDVVQLEGPATKSSEKSSVKHVEASGLVEPACPSAFAQALLGSAPPSSAYLPQMSYALPYMAFTSSVADAFSDPSPDDIVLTAQAKGSILRARKIDK
jgi:elongation factor 1 alpha-like protein